MQSIMPDDTATQPKTCREFLGERGWCPSVATIWRDNAGFCGHHAAARQMCEVETLRRNGRRVA